MRARYCYTLNSSTVAWKWCWLSVLRRIHMHSENRKQKSIYVYVYWVQECTWDMRDAWLMDHGQGFSSQSITLCIPYCIKYMFHRTKVNSNDNPYMSCANLCHSIAFANAHRVPFEIRRMWEITRLGNYSQYLRRIEFVSIGKLATTTEQVCPFLHTIARWELDRLKWQLPFPWNRSNEDETLTGDNTMTAPTAYSHIQRTAPNKFMPLICNNGKIDSVNNPTLSGGQRMNKNWYGIWILCFISAGKWRWPTDVFLFYGFILSANREAQREKKTEMKATHFAFIIRK